MWKQIFAFWLCVTLALTTLTAPSYGSDATVTVCLKNTVTGEIVWEETSTVPAGASAIEVPRALFELIEKAFETTTFEPGKYTAYIGANELSITVSENLTVTFTPRQYGWSVPATDVETVKKLTVKDAKTQKSKPSQTATSGVLGAPCHGTKYAIVIGISDYPGTENDLLYSDDDARDMNRTLVDTYGYVKDNIILLMNGEATRTNIMNAIAQLKARETGGDDEIVFFFSGHGTKGVAADGDKERIDEAIVSHDGTQLVPIWDGELRLEFSGFETTRIICIFDSCLAGGMTDLQTSERIIAMATTERGVAYEGESWENGQFTYYLVEQGMLFGSADRVDHDADAGTRDVTVEEAFDYAKANCSHQTPVISDNFPNDLLL
ncbi:MAG: caspase family protein [Candidatus Bathyarchaeia archaeon]